MTVEKTGPITGSVEAKFAQRLAANEKKHRDRAFKKLRQYLIARSARTDGGFGRDELIKLWKGLFYCVWMSDKPLIQEELVKGIAGVLPQLKNIKTTMMYFEAFLETMHREWQGIDRLRMDKFYLLCRFMLQSLFQCLKDNQWEQGVVEWAAGVLRNGPLSLLTPGPSKTTGPPLGLRYHFIDVYLEELSSASDKSLTSTEILMLLTPLAQLVCRTPVKDLRNRGIDKIFQEIIDQSEPAQKLIHEVNDTDESEIEKLNLDFDYSAIADLLFKIANEETTLPRNRKKVYAIVQKLRGVAEGQMPLDDLPDIMPDEDYNSKKLEEKMFKDLAAELQEEHRTGKLEKLEHKKSKKKQKHLVDSSLCEADVLEGTYIADTTSAEKHKLQQSKRKSSKNVPNVEADSTTEAIIIGSSSDLNNSIFDSSIADSTVLELNEGSKSKKTPKKIGKTKKMTTQNKQSQVTMHLEVTPQMKKVKKRKSAVTSAKSVKKQKLLQLLKDSEVGDNNVQSSHVESPFTDIAKTSQQDKPDAKNKECVTGADEKAFATFVSSPSKPATSSFVRVAASKVAKKQKGNSVTTKRKSLPADMHSSKRVSFEMSKIQVQPFRKTDRSSAVSPSPSSVAFDPNKTPDFGLLKHRKTQVSSVVKSHSARKSAADFF